jgi:hypothetical protein
MEPAFLFLAVALMATPSRVPRSRAARCPPASGPEEARAGQDALLDYKGGPRTVKLDAKARKFSFASLRL